MKRQGCNWERKEERWERVWKIKEKFIKSMVLTKSTDSELWDKTKWSIEVVPNGRTNLVRCFIFLNKYSRTTYTYAMWTKHWALGQCSDNGGGQQRECIWKIYNFIILNFVVFVLLKLLLFTEFHPIANPADGLMEGFINTGHLPPFVNIKQLQQFDSHVSAPTHDEYVHVPFSLTLNMLDIG